MGAFEAKQREIQEAGGSVIVASAARIPLDDRKLREAHKKRNITWQPEAWRFYDEVGEIWFAHNFVGNMLSRIRIFAALEGDQDQPPETITDSSHPAYVEMERLEQGEGTSAMLHMLGINLGVPGECVLLGFEHPEDGETWGIFSYDQIIINGRGRWALREDPNDKVGIDLDPATTVMIRVWRNHPRWKRHADSPMRPLLSLCDELQILSRSIRATGRSRLTGAGMLLWPKEAVVEPNDPNRQWEPGQDAFIGEMIEAMTTPIADEASAAAVVPFVVKLPGEQIDRPRHLTFAREMDTIEAEQRKEVITRITYGLDIPNEVVTGASRANHWSAWLVDEQTFKAHLEPLILTICSALTKGFLKPAVEGTPDEEKVIVWYDASGLLGHPNRAQDAKDAHAAMVINDDALRRYLGFPDTDAPDDDELERRIAVEKGTLDPAAMINLLQATGLLQGVMPPQPAASPINVPSEEKPVSELPTGQDKQGGPPAKMPDGTPVQGSAARGSLRNRGSVLTAMDRELRRRLLDAADAAMNRAIERAGAKMRRKAARQVAGTLKDVPQRLVMATVGREAAEAFSVDEQGIIDEELGGLEDQWDTWVGGSQAQVQTLAKRWALVNPDDIDFGPYDQQQNDDRHAGWLVLAGALSALTLERMFNPAPEAPRLGETDISVFIPTGVMRSALARAGGDTKITSAGDPLQAAAGGVATGDVAQQIFLDVGLRTSGYTWVYGDPSSRRAPFDPHEELDGIEFTSFDDQQLINTFDFPDTPTLFPGDHDGCQCDFEVTITQDTEAE